MYSDFASSVKMEMNVKLNSKRVRLQDSATSNKRRRSQKPWWTDELSRLWNNMCSAETHWRNETGNRKTELKAVFLSLRRQFDRIVQRSKRQYWFRMQNDIEHLDRNNTQEFWKTIGKIGVGNERRKNIPFEVEIDGRVSRDRQTVLENGKTVLAVCLTP